MATHCVARELIALGHDVKQVPSGMRTRSRKFASCIGLSTASLSSTHSTIS
jgi:hypothetical protein